MTVSSFYVMRMYHWSICFPLSFFVSFFISFFLSFFLSFWIRLFIHQFFIKHSKIKILAYIMTYIMKKCRKNGKMRYQIWRRRRKNSKLVYFQLFRINKVQIFIQGPAGKWLNGLLWYFLNLFNKSWKGGTLQSRHHTIRGLTSHLTSKS